MFRDEVTIVAAGGRGGDGRARFRKEKYTPRGGPDGGDGGDGGDVLIAADANLTSLNHIGNRKKYRAGDGQPGGGAKRRGANGGSVVIRVPPGTIIRDTQTARISDEALSETHTGILARGGRGGRGNTHFASPTNRAPRTFEPGTDGESVALTLTYHIPADAALAGFPNSGKSSLAAALAGTSHSPPPHPFSTTAPFLLTFMLNPFARIRLIDLPSIPLTDRAAGTGALPFLKHLLRPGIVLLTLDCASDAGPVEQFDELYRILSVNGFSPGGKKTVALLTRSDLAADPGGVEKARAALAARGAAALATSVHDTDSLGALRETLVKLLEIQPDM
ncbi:MAG: GTPase [bacterium]